jgi:copper chaperone
MTRTYRVSGMNCDGCARSLTAAITRLAPAARVAVDLPGSKITVEEDPGEEVIARAVSNAGFHFEGAA